MEESLILQIPCAELLQEQVRVLDNLLHFGVILLTEKNQVFIGTISRPCFISSTDFICFKMNTNPIIGDLQQVQHDFVGAHVLQQPLLLLKYT